MKRIFAGLLLLCILSLSMISCAGTTRGGEQTNQTTSSATTAVTDVTKKTRTRKTTEEPAKPVEYEVKWNLGYISSDMADPNHLGSADNCHFEKDGKTFSYTDVIEIPKKGTTVSFTDPKNAPILSACFIVSSWKKNGSGSWVLDTNGANIAGDSFGAGLLAKTTSAGTVYTYVTSRDGECIRFCYRSGQQTKNQQMDFPKIYVTASNEPGGSLPDAVGLDDWIEAGRATADYSILQGKKIYCIGDSYFDGVGLQHGWIWPALLARKYGMDLYNYGIDGSTISDFYNASPMVGRYDKLPAAEPDILIVEGGRNEYNHNVPIGNDGSTDTKTSKGALRYLLTELRTRYPNAVIIFVTQWKVGGNANNSGIYCDEYGAALKKVCTDLGVPYIDAMDQTVCPVKMTEAAFRQTYCMSAGDISHLNLAGMKLAMPFFEKQIAEIYTAATVK